MDRTDLSTKTILITASIWLGIFFLFTCTAVTLAVTSNPLFSLLIMVGILPSTLAAYFYAAENRHNPAVPCDPLNAQELQVVPKRSPPRPSLVSLRGSSSEPCLCAGPVPALRRSSSSPWMARYSAPSSVRPITPIQSELVAISESGQQQTDGSNQEPAGQVLPVAAVKENEFRDDVETPTAEISEEEQPHGNADRTDADSITSTETAFTGSPDGTAFWKDVVSDRRGDSRSSHRSVGTTPLLSSSPSSRSSGSSVPDDCHYLPFCEDYLEEKTVLLVSTSPSRDAGAGFVGGAERQPSDEGFLEIQQRTPIVSPPLQTNVAQAAEKPSVEVPVGVNLGGESSQLAPAKSFEVVGVRDEDPYGVDGGSRPKKSKRKLKLIPRFLKGKKKEFVRLK